MPIGKDSRTGAARAILEERMQEDPDSRSAIRPPRAAARAGTAAPRLAPLELVTRIDEEICRASRHRGSLCCLLVQITNLSQITQMHGEEFAEHALEHVGDVLRTELRQYDRVGHPLEEELVVVLPGAGRAQGEAVARRVLHRLRAIKVEIEQVRQPLAISVGIAAWTEPWSAERLIEEARAAAVATGCEQGS